MAYSFNYDLTKLPREFFKDIAEIVNKRKLHLRLGVVSRGIVKDFRVDKILGIRLEDAISVVEDLVDIHIKNLISCFRSPKMK